MSATYNGVPASGSITAPIAITEPADGDAMSAASVNTALEKIADNVALLQAIDNGATTAKTLETNASGATTPTTGPEAGSIMAGATGYVRQFAASDPASGHEPTGTLTAAAGSTATYTFVGNDLCGSLYITASGSGISTGKWFTITPHVARPGGFRPNAIVLLQPFGTDAVSHHGDFYTLGLDVNSLTTDAHTYAWNYVIVWY